MFQIYKKAGFTPLQALTEYKETHPEYKNSTLSYAGRLDPMAEGILLILEGDENKQRRTYEHMSKTYEFEILVGFSTDTYDVMGMITESSSPELFNFINLTNFINSLGGSHTFPYPPYSSKYVNGHPLYWYAKRNILHTITIPKQKIQIDRIEVTQQRLIQAEDMLESIQTRLLLVKGNFRQQEIINQWNTILSDPKQQFHIIKCKIDCSSGTYIRSIVNHLSQQLTIPLLTFSIKRTAVNMQLF